MPSGERHGIGKIYTYKNGKIKSILKAGSDNMELDVYKKSKSIIVKTSYHDYEASEYYTYKNGRYRLKATKCYNSMVPRKWYENADEKEISKSEFKKKTKGIVKGKKTKIEHTDLKYCTGYYGY